MVREHAITYQDRLTPADLAYLVMKANRLGKAKREIIHVHEERDDEGTHVYYEVTGLSNESRRVSDPV